MPAFAARSSAGRCGWPRMRRGNFRSCPSRMRSNSYTSTRSAGHPSTRRRHCGGSPATSTSTRRRCNSSRRSRAISRRGRIDTDVRCMSSTQMPARTRIHTPITSAPARIVRRTSPRSSAPCGTREPHRAGRTRRPPSVLRHRQDRCRAPRSSPEPPRPRIRIGRTAFRGGSLQPAIGRASPLPVSSRPAGGTGPTPPSRRRTWADRRFAK